MITKPIPYLFGDTKYVVPNKKSNTFNLVGVSLITYSLKNGDNPFIDMNNVIKTIINDAKIVRDNKTTLTILSIIVFFFMELLFKTLGPMF